MTQAEEDFLRDYTSQPYHRFRDVEQYVALLEKMKTEADRQATF